MINRFTLYIGKTILTMTLLTIILLLGLEFIFEFVNEMRHVGTGDYTLSHAIFYILLSLPHHLCQLFPMSALLGTLLGLGLLAQRSELIVMRAAGLSIGSITLSVLKCGFILSLIVWSIGEWVAPIAEKYAHYQKGAALSKGQAIGTLYGTWLKNGDDFVHIQAIDDKKALKGVTRYQFDENMRLVKASFAERAEYHKNRWILYNIQATEFKNDHTVRERSEKQEWISHIEPTILDLVGSKELDELTLSGLKQIIHYREVNGLDPKPYQMAFFQKLIQPLTMLVMMFLAIPFIFGPLRSATMGLRTLVGVLVGFTFFTFSQLFGPLTLVYQLPPLIGAMMPTLTFFLLGIWVLKKAG